MLRTIVLIAFDASRIVQADTYYSIIRSQDPTHDYDGWYYRFSSIEYKHETENHFLQLSAHSGRLSGNEWLLHGSTLNASGFYDLPFDDLDTVELSVEAVSFDWQDEESRVKSEIHRRGFAESQFFGHSIDITAAVDESAVSAFTGLELCNKMRDVQHEQISKVIDIVQELRDDSKEKNTELEMLRWELGTVKQNESKLRFAVKAHDDKMLQLKMSHKDELNTLKQQYEAEMSGRDNAIQVMRRYASEQATQQRFSHSVHTRD